MSLILTRLKNRKWSTLSFLLVFNLLFTLLPFGTYKSQEARLKTKELLENNSRGIYDILVRPANARTAIEKKYQTVEENYLSDGKGGISLAEWKAIKKNPLVEIAAPAASLGYVPGFNYVMEFPDPTDKKSYKYSFQFYTTDGISEYPIGESTSTYYLFNPLSTENTGTWEYFSSSYNRISALSESGSATRYPIPTPYSLVVAIDPVSEKLLTGLSTDYLLTPGENPGYIDDVKDAYIKILRRQDARTPVICKVKLEPIQVDVNQLLKKYGVKNNFTDLLSEGKGDFSRLREDLDRIPVQSPATIYNVDLSTVLKPFEGKNIIFNNKWVPRYKKFSDEGLYRTEDTTILCSPIPYEEKNGLLSANIIDYNGKIPKYKGTEESIGDFLITGVHDTPFIVENIGSKYASAPLGFYETPKAITSDGKKMNPTIFPGSFIASEAYGVTSMDNIEAIKGNKPIDAIRIRVAGVTKLDQKGKRKIQALAKDLLQQGYTVDTVAGSSPKTIKVDVEGVGTVSEQWTLLGAAGSLEKSWSVLSILVIGLFSIFSLCWLSSRLLMENASFLNERTILFQVGWTKKQIRRFERQSYFFPLSISFLCSIVLLFLLNTPWYSFIICGGLSIVSFTGISIFTKEKNVKERTLNGSKQITPLRYYARYTFQLFLITTMSFLLLSLLSLNIYRLYQDSGETTLGYFINHSTLSLQITLVIVALLMTVTAIYESFKVLIDERKDEFILFKYVGWKKNEIYRKMLRESMGWYIPGVLAGFMMASMTARVLDSDVFTIVTITMLVAAVISIILMLTLFRHLNRTLL